ncbi:MAG: ABC transporter permease [Chryseolinea sp.]
MDTFSHFFKIPSRTIRQNKFATFTNVIGIALSLTIVLLITLYIVDESTFDSHHPDSERVYRLGFGYNRYGDGAEEIESRTAGMWSIKLKETMPEIESFTRFSRFGYAGIVQLEEEQKSFVEQEFFWVDSTFTDIFAVPLVSAGEARTILKDPRYVIISEKSATKYFGNDDPLNKSLHYSRFGMDFHFIVGGVMKNYPANSHFHPDFIVNDIALNPLWKRDGNDRMNSWGDTFTYAYVKVRDGVDETKIDEGLKRVFVENLPPETVKLIWPRTIKMTDIHFAAGFVAGIEPASDGYYLFIFGSIGLLILLMACINYINMATIKSLKRVKEIGLKKTLGAGRSSLVLQFFGESFMTTIIALCIAVVLFILILPFFNQLANKDFDFTVLFEIKYASLVGVIALFVAVGAGTYPSLYLSSFRPIEALSGRLKSSKTQEIFRKVLVVFQFSIAMLLIVGTIVIQRQLSLVNTTKLNEYKDQVVCVRVFGLADPKNFETLRNFILKDARFSDVSFGAQLPRQKTSNWIDTKLTVPTLGQTTHIWRQLNMRPNFPTMFNLKIISGRTFTVGNPGDTSAILLNESAVRDLKKTPEEAIGLIVTEQEPVRSREVIGVIQDFQYSSMKDTIQPLMICNDYKNAEMMYARIAGSDLSASVESLQKSWNKIYPGAPFEFSFMDQEFGRLYEMENRIGLLFKYFTALAIVIGCLGLYGLASFTAEQKIKEIGVRKILGSSVLQIVLLLTNRFLKLVALSFLFGIPAAYYLILLWLENFAYKTRLSVDVFTISAAVILVMTFLTVGTKALTASLANPIDSVRNN